MLKLHKLINRIKHNSKTNEMEVHYLQCKNESAKRKKFNTYSDILTKKKTDIKCAKTFCILTFDFICHT